MARIGSFLVEIAGGKSIVFGRVKSVAVVCLSTGRELGLVYFVTTPRGPRARCRAISSKARKDKYEC
jgi:hypothetical protein